MRRTADAGVRALQAGRTVVHPTDTLYAIAARAADRRAVARLVRTKGRPTARPLSVAVSSTEELARWGHLHPGARRFVRLHLPGPYTVLLRPTPFARARLAPQVAGGARIGLRVPDHGLARELARRVGPIVATSANVSGAPPARRLEDARRQLGRAVAVYLDEPPRPNGRPSVVVDLARARPRPRPRR